VVSDNPFLMHGAFLGLKFTSTKQAGTLLVPSLYVIANFMVMQYSVAEPEEPLMIVYVFKKLENFMKP
jgi:hypothetical protein